MKENKVFLKKKIKKLKKLFNLNFESKGLYISFWLLKLKKKKLKIIKEIQYLKTNRYVIPLPSEDEEKPKKSKKKILFYTKFINLYNFYENFFKNQQFFFYSSIYSVYNPSKNQYVTKFEHTIKFEILWNLWNIFCLFTEQSFAKNYLKWYFSTKKFKFFSMVFFWDMFNKYWSSNLPLLWRKGENYTPRVEGTAYLQVRDIIFWELVYEKLHLTYKYTDEDKFSFLQANIDPFDKRYFWWTRRFYLLGLSIHDGKISFDENQKYYWSFSEIPTSVVDNYTLFCLRKKILAQFIYWKEKLKQLAVTGKLFYDINKINKLHISNSYNYYNSENYELKDFFENKLNLLNYNIFKKYPIPEFYYGSINEFFDLQHNYLLLPIVNLQQYEMFNILFETDITRFLQKFKFLNSKEIFKNLNLFVVKNKTYSSINVELINVKKNKILYNLEKNSFSIQKFSNITPEKVIRFFELKKIANLKKKDILSFYPIPRFLKIFFLILLQNKITTSDLDEYCLELFLYKLSAYKKAFFKAKKNVSNFLGSLQTFKFYFELPETYNSKDFTMPYKIFFENLKKYPNKDIGLRRIEPFGLNPFWLTTKFLTIKDVPFPEIVDYYTYYKVIIKQQFSLLKEKNNIVINESLKFKIKILILNFFILKNNFIFGFLFGKRIKVKRKILKFFRLNNYKCFSDIKSKIKLFFDNSNFINNINESINQSSLDFIDFNSINYKNFTKSQLFLIRQKNSKKIKIDFFSKIAEKFKTQFIMTVMHKLLTLNFFFQQEFTTSNILHYHYTMNNFSLFLNYQLSMKFYNYSNNFISYNFNYMTFLKTYYFSNFFYVNFSNLFKLNLRK